MSRCGPCDLLIFLIRDLTLTPLTLTPSRPDPYPFRHLIEVELLEDRP